MLKMIRSIWATLPILALALTGCQSQQAHIEMPAETSAVEYAPGAWRDMVLTDSRTLETFKLSDFSGSVVILEMMDPGCPICKNQLEQIAAALEQVGDRSFAISVDIGYKGAEALVKWAETNGATWPVAFITREFSRALTSEFGPAVVYPGNTPVIIIDPSGGAHVTENGIKDAATIVELVDQWAP